MVTKKKRGIKKGLKKKLKKVVKKSQKKVAGKKSKQSSISRKDFETFQFGVGRLKELRRELNSLDARGFSGEEQAIRARLKNVSDIPMIERSIKSLKLRINKKYRPSRRRGSVKKDIHDIKEDLPKLKGEIKKLSKEVEGGKKKKGRIDSGVGMLIDTDFNVFLSDIKSSLSNRTRAKEKEMDSILKNDLEKREQGFRERYVALSQEFNKKYEKKVKTSLQKEISEKFNEQLKKKLQTEKVSLGKRYKEELKEHADKELEKRRNDINDILQKKEERIRENLTKEFHKDLREELSKKERIIRKMLNSEFELKLKREIQEHESRLKKRKLNLELEMQRKIKQVLR